VLTSFFAFQTLIREDKSELLVVGLCGGSIH
jgi:hypothetical protein